MGTIKGDRSKIGLIFSGQQVPFEEANIFITQPTVRQIFMFGEDNFLMATQLITKIDTFFPEEVKNQLEVVSNFQLLMKMIQSDNGGKTLLANYFDFIFPDYLIQITDNSIDFIIQQEEDDIKVLVGKIHPFNFETFQFLIEDCFLPKALNEQIEYNPANDLAASIAKKIEEGRKKIAERKGATQEDSLYAQYVSILAIGLSLDINILLDYTSFQLFDMVRRYFLKQYYDLYQKVSTTPLMDVSQMDTPDEWTDSLYK